MKWLQAIAVLLSVLVVAAVVITAALFQLYWGIFTPIRFYGKVVDTDGHPVPAAQIYVSFDEFPYSPGVRDDTSSDENGNFSIWGHGAAIVIMTSKGGYYKLPESDGNFPTWPPGNRESLPQGMGDYWHSSSSNPVKFTLRKMGVCEPIIQHGGDFGLNIKVKGDGTPISMDLTAGRIYRLTEEDLKVQAWINDQDVRPGSVQHFDWRYKISIPGGGLQIRNSEFDFQAPQDGYLPSDEINVSSSDPQWNSSATREYFLKLATGKYARIKITVAVGGNDGFTITSYLNPQIGHRNLEYDPSLKVGE
jgi:hypothetical protein